MVASLLIFTMWITTYCHSGMLWVRFGHTHGLMDTSKVRQAPLVKSRLTFTKSTAFSGARLKAIVWPEGQRATYAYDGSDRLESIRSPLGYLTTSVWNVDDQKIALVDPLGRRQDPIPTTVLIRLKQSRIRMEGSLPRYSMRPVIARRSLTHSVLGVHLLLTHLGKSKQFKMHWETERHLHLMT